MRKFINKITALSFLLCCTIYTNHAEPLKGILSTAQNLFEKGSIEQVPNEITQAPSSASTLLIIKNGMILGTAACGIYLLKRWYNLNSIQSWITKSSPIIKNAKDFRFSGWQQFYATKVSTIKERSSELKRILSVMPHEIHIFDGSQEIEKPNEDQKKRSFDRELEAVKEDLEYLAQFTEFPTLLLSYANNEFGKPKTDNHSLSNKILVHCQLRHELGKLDDFETLVRQTKNFIKPTFSINSFTSILDRLVYRPIQINVQRDNEKEREQRQENNLHYTRSSNPWTWKIVSRKQATKLYYKVLNRYMRLLTLKDIVTQSYYNSDKSEYYLINN
jgi:hypothetical protein